MTETSLTTTGTTTGATTGITANPIEDVLALSPLQQGLFSMAVLADNDYADGDPYVIAMAADIAGELDEPLLHRCADAMLVRHPNLRASFVHGDLSRPVQVVPARARVPWRTVTAAPDDVAELEAAERRRPFDLGHGPLIRFLLIALPQSRWRLVVVAHHIVIDGWSLPLFVGEMITLYQGGGALSALPPAPRPYRDYIGWLAARDTDAGRDLWRRHLHGLDDPTLLTPALTGAAAPQGIPRRTEVTLDAQATAALAGAARRRGVTLNTLVQISWATILSAFTDRADVTFGVTVSGRPGELAGVQNMVGLFINTVPLRVALDPAEPVGRQCVALQREAAALREHSYFPHAELRALGGVGELFDTLLVYENFPPGGVVGAAEFRAGGAVFRPAALESLSHFPVTIAAYLADGALTVLVETIDGALGPMAPDGLGERVLTTVQRMVDGWERPLREVSVLSDAEAAQARAQAAACDGSAPPDREGGVHTRFAEVAAAHPDAVALSWEAGGIGGQMSYADLDAAAERLAAALGGAAGPEVPVAINLARGPDYVVAMLAVLKAGAVIVPLDPGMPADRVADILEQSGAVTVIDRALLDEVRQQWVQQRVPGGLRPAPGGAERAAYMVFTSGTTGRPKGVIGTHRALLAYAEDHARTVLAPAAQRLGRPLRVAHAWSFTFDAAWQPLAALLAGHAVHVVGDDAQRDAEALVSVIERFELDMIDTTPSMFAQLNDAGLLTRVPLAVLALGGEAVGTPTWRLIRAECARTAMTAYNCYGPTETTVEAVVADIAAHPQPCIGGPTGPTAAHVLDSWLRPVPDGAAGELYLAGEQLTRGYLGRPAETAARYLADPARPGRRMYRTGDVVRRAPDGALQFLGRSDDQVKIRGFRVEPGEVAAVLHGHPDVRAAHVVARRHRGGARLIAYVAAGPSAPPAAELRALAGARLPRYMVPQHLVVVDELPLTPHGKVDESALAALDLGAEPATGPQTPTEELLAGLLGEVLETEHVDVTAEFLQLGLDSIAALSVVQAARRRGIEMRARLMLDCTTIRELAAALDAGHTGSTPAPLDDDRYGEVPAVPIMSWMYEAGGFRRFTQNMLIDLPAGVSADLLTAVLQGLLDRHDMLRSVLHHTADGYRLVTRAPGSVTAHSILRHVPDSGPQVLADEAPAALERIDPADGSMVQAVWFTGARTQLLLCVHHLATDVVSWYVILAALNQLAAQLASGETPSPAAEYTTYRHWARLLDARARTAEVADQRDYWATRLRGPDPVLGSRLPDPAVDTWGSLRVTDVTTEPAVTRRLLDGLDTAAGAGGAVELRDVLLAALAMAVASWRQRRGQPVDAGALIALESHGREDALLGPAVDTSATVGWFTSVFPVRLGAGRQALSVSDARADPRRTRGLVRSVTAEIAAVPNRGLDYGLLRYGRADPALVGAGHPQIEFNYIGRYDLSADRAGRDTGTAWSMNTEPAFNGVLPAASEPDLPLRYTFDVISVVSGSAAGPQLLTSWRWSERLTSAGEADELAALFNAAVEVLADGLAAGDTAVGDAAPGDGAAGDTVGGQP